MAPTCCNTMRKQQEQPPALNLATANMTAPRYLLQSKPLPLKMPMTTLGWLLISRNTSGATKSDDTQYHRDCSESDKAPLSQALQKLGPGTSNHIQAQILTIKSASWNACCTFQKNTSIALHCIWQHKPMLHPCWWSPYSLALVPGCMACSCSSLIHPCLLPASCQSCLVLAASCPLLPTLSCLLLLPCLTADTAACSPLLAAKRTLLLLLPLLRSC